MISFLILQAAAIDPELVAVLLTIITGIVGAPIIQVVKDALGLEDKAAVGVATATSIALAAVIMAVNSAFSGFDFSLESVSIAAASVFSLATLYYKLIMTGSKPANPEPAE